MGDIDNYWYVELRFPSWALLFYYCVFCLLSSGIVVFMFTYKLFSIRASILICFIPSFCMSTVWQLISERRHSTFILISAWERFRLPPLGVQLGDQRAWESVQRPGWWLRVSRLHCLSKQSHYSCLASRELSSQQDGLSTEAVCTPALPGSRGAFPHIPELSLRVGD